MSIVTLNWEQFLQEATEFQKISERLNASWTLYRKDEQEGNAYLIYEQKIMNTVDQKSCTDVLEDTNCYIEGETAAVPPSNDLLKIEYHVVYSISYQVPVLYFRIYRNDGSMLCIEEAWRIFRDYGDDDSRTNGVDGTVPHTATDMLSIMTQLDHPVLGKPYIAIHPCRTAELLAQAGNSRNNILTFISLMGPYVQLNLSNEYGKQYTES
ncbi:PREDICTED: ubiquitin-like-conjugating enzyme ATG10 [Bactrocera latifrons]|uniref:Ubiquitin-like-conjugating enzyme ATG10 n=1 Tax=Bactrocera latifrons TaxID=174628 RepID=A0A0K8VWS2_BACLA|nr:PREDICTED: ubiquitin-like-conjugating enzyme ATG10 [Bactrocera latifrons]XP_018795694.1 PREDICTED: ubiquitin-like-conjugating enzyme ATG10 [Bactrocera latifrons]